MFIPDLLAAVEMPSAREIRLDDTASASKTPLSAYAEPEPEAAPAEASQPKASSRAITINLITGGLGSAIFSLPWSVAGSSVLPSVVIIAAVLLLNFWTIAIVVRAAERYNVFDLGGVIRHLPYGGAVFEAVTNVFVWISMFLCLVSYIIVIHDSAYKLVQGTWMESRLFLVGLASLFVLPLCFLSQRLLEKTSSLAIAVNIYLFCLIGFLYVQKVSTHEAPEDCCLIGATIQGNFSMITVMFQAVIVQMCVLPMYQELEHRSPQKFDRIVAVSFSALFCIFCGFSILGYLLVGPKVQSNILQDFPENLGATIAQIGIMLVVACVYPIMVYPMIAPIRADLGGSIYGINRTSIVTGAKVVIVLAAMFTALCLDSLGFVNVLNGAMSAGVFVALVPSVVGMALLDTSSIQKVALGILLVGGSALSCMGFVFSDNYVSDLRCLAWA